MMTYDRHNSHRLRSSVYHRKHIDTERVLQSGLFVKHIDDILRICIFPELQNDPYTVFRGLIGDIDDICGGFVLYQPCDII